MRFLLDVNVLLALALPEHEGHSRTVRWMKPRSSRRTLEVATCSITELGFVRILAQPVYRYSIREAQELLGQLKAIPDLDFTFLPDHQSAAGLPAWVRKPADVTDGHLSELARVSGAILATLDNKISGSFLIPA